MTAISEPSDGRTDDDAAHAIDGWLAELGLTPVERAQREGATSWDLVLDGRKRRALRITLMLDPDVALIAWVHLAPPVGDNFRKTYRQLLRWNDELPFAKFAVSEDERPLITLETPVAALSRDDVGRLLARALALTDLVHDQAMVLMGELRRRQAFIEKESPVPDGAGVALMARYAEELRELES